MIDGALFFLAFTVGPWVETLLAAWPWWAPVIAAATAYWVAVRLRPTGRRRRGR